MAVRRGCQDGHVSDMTLHTRVDQHYRDHMSPSQTGPQGLAEVVLRARKELGWTQDVLAQKAKVSVETIKRYERGKIQWPEPEKVRSIFRALGLDPREIPVILGLVTRAELDLPPVIEPAVRRFSAETERIIAALEDPAFSAAEKAALYQLLIVRIGPRAAGGGNQRQAG